MSVDSAAAQPATPDSLIEQCLSGDQVAWETIVRQNWRKVFNVAYKFVGKHDEAEDLTQDIFLKIFKALKTFDRRANFQTWIISISRNLCIDHYRSVRKERQMIAREVDTSDLQPASSFNNANVSTPTLTYDANGNVTNTWTVNAGAPNDIMVTVRKCFTWRLRSSSTAGSSAGPSQPQFQLRLSFAPSRLSSPLASLCLPL